MVLIQTAFFVLVSILGGTCALNVKVKKATNPSYDPRECNSAKRGAMIIVKDRHNEDKLLVCVKERKFHWKVVDGHSYGNYFDPAEDCSDVVDNVPEAENGIYWIKTNKGPKKVWCDVDTDGGGFMLIGAKDTPVSKAIPFRPSVVVPRGKSHWSSSFGDKQVLDFRVQVSTSQSFDDTKVNWYYHFRSSRKLTELLLQDKGGCSRTYPGIGDVAYVKDLKNNKIVTKTFNCSRFGSHFFHGLGWGKMNSCFNTPCPKGFGHIAGNTYVSDGSFSYSVVSSKSGMRDRSTAFLGCDQKCCACFGPSSDKDYCAPNCQAINGGTVLTKNDTVYAWFWIRSSLPKRVWKKCMEYEEKNSAGKIEIWHVDKDGVPRKGQCSSSRDVRLNDGVAVVSNIPSLNSLPKMEGLLAYRSDNRKLYLRGKNRWKAIGNYEEFQNNREVIKNILGKQRNLIRQFQKNKNVINNILRQLTSLKKDIETIKLRSAESCKRVLEVKSDARNGYYKIKTQYGGYSNTYCQMTSLRGCSGGGWTMVMKINGKKGTFAYSSSYWSNKQSYNPSGGLTGIDDQETKLPTYWSTSFRELCVGMKVGNDLRFISFSYPASSLYNLIADGRYRSTNLGRGKWRSLIRGSSLQNNCNREGFNVKPPNYVAVRIGILTNQENDCNSVDSYVGFGGYQKIFTTCLFTTTLNSAGNIGKCAADNGNKNIKAMGYILVR